MRVRLTTRGPTLLARRVHETIKSEKDGSTLDENPKATEK